MYDSSYIFAFFTTFFLYRSLQPLFMVFDFKLGKKPLGRGFLNICILYGKTNTIIDIWDKNIIAYN